MDERLIMMCTYYHQGEFVLTQGGNDTPPVCVNNVVKSYKIDTKARRKLISAAYKLKKTASNKLVFLTFTLPWDASETEASIIIKNTFSNLIKHYRLNNYVWTKERQKSGRIHFHAILDIPFFEINNLENTYIQVIHNYNGTIACYGNSVRLPHSSQYGNIVYGCHSVAEYISKYVTKSTKESYRKRCYQVSKGLFPVVEKYEYTEFLKKVYTGKVEKKHNIKFGAVYKEKRR